jgi:Zn2+/Cd2+-exporting ATPase
MAHSVQIDLPLLLPDLPDTRDACVNRLTALISPRPGIQRVHVRTEVNPPELCVHYDPQIVSLAEVQRLATAAGAQMQERYGHGVWQLRAISGEDAGRRIEDALASVDGVLSVSVNLAAQTAGVEFDRRRFQPAALNAAIKDLGFSPAATPEAVPPAKAAPASWFSRNRELAWSTASGAFLVIAWSLARFAGVMPPLTTGIYVLSYVFGAYDMVRHSMGALRKGKFALDIDLLMLLAAIGAAILGEWAEGAFLLFLFSLAHSLEHYALGRARDSIRALADLAPPVARVQQGSSTVEVPVEQVKPGDLVLVRPAERIPVDGRIQSGKSGVNQAPITGESVPVDKVEGDEVFAGTVNGEGALTITTTRAAGDRTLDRVMKLVAEAQTSKAPTQVFTDRFERIFVPIVLLSALLLIVLPPVLGIWTWSISFYRGMALLVASSPCALALGTPSTVLAGIAQAARRGVLIKGGVHLENLGTIEALALDKTGTLTMGQPEVTDVITTENVNERELLEIASAVEKESQHPLARAVVRRGEKDNVQAAKAESLESITGRGVRARVDNQVVEIGNVRLFEEAGAPLPPKLQEAVAKLQSQGRSVMIVRQGGRWLGVMGMADKPRDGVKNVLDALRKLGIRSIVMLTGDHRGVGDAIGKEVGVDEVRAELMPEDKVTAIKALLEKHRRVAMVGDGVNDAPALAQATVGIAMGGAGTAAALETADVALMADDLGRLPFAIGLSRQARAVIRQNLYLSLGVIALLVVATTTGFFGIGAAVFVHEGSTLIVIANALRLLVYEVAS